MNSETRERLDSLIAEARELRKTRRAFWSDYSDFKKRMVDMPLSNRAYENFIDELTKALGL